MAESAPSSRFTPLIILALVAALVTTIGFWARDRAGGGSNGGGVAATQATGDVIEWKMITTWPKNFPGLGLAAENLATAVEEMSNGRLTIKVYGRDAADRQRSERAWKALWYRSSGPAPAAGRVQQVEHEALALLVAERADVRVPEVIEAGQDEGGDVVLVVVEPEGTPIGELDADAVTDEALQDLWRALDRLRGVGATIALPRIEEDGSMSFRLADGEALEDGSRVGATLVRPHVVLVRGHVEDKGAEPGRTRAGAALGRTELLAMYHDFQAESGTAGDYGSELDLRAIHRLECGVDVRETEAARVMKMRRHRDVAGEIENRAEYPAALRGIAVADGVGDGDAHGEWDAFGDADADADTDADGE